MMWQQAEVTLGLLGDSVAACDEATVFPWELLRRLGDVEATLKGTKEVSPDVPRDLVAKVAKAEWLWEASYCLATRHLLGSFGDIKTLIWSSCCDPDAPCGCVVAEKCQRAMEDIPEAASGQWCHCCDVIGAVTSSGTVTLGMCL